MPSAITIVGLGPGSSRHWTQAAHDLLTSGNEVCLRTHHHPSTPDIVANVRSFDAWYQNGSDPTGRIAAEIVRRGQRNSGVVYAVPGHPGLGEATAPAIRRLAQLEKLPVTIVPGLSAIESTLSLLEVDGIANLQLCDASLLATRYHPILEPDRPALLTNCHGPAMIQRIQAVLLNAYPDNFEVAVVAAAESGVAPVWRGLLAAIAAQPQHHGLTTLHLPADTRSSFSTFQNTIAHLRAPNGCPWDREQTHQSLRPYLLEESYEVLEALDAGDMAGLAEELGDLLLQILLHTQIAIDNGEFKMGTVIDHINRKLLRRHPHVFGDVEVNSIAEVASNWEAIKKAEKAAKNKPDSSASALDGIPPALPALAEAMAVSKRAVRVGFEWPNIEGVLEKVIEEAHEIAEATDPAHLESEIGDLLFSVVNLARWQNIDPESALRATNARFGRRFRQIETLAAAQGSRLTELSIEEMDRFWDEAKRLESH